MIFPGRYVHGPDGRIHVLRRRADRLSDDQLVTDLQYRVADLTRALKGLVAAMEDTSLANRQTAVAAARRVLAKSNPRPTAT